MVKLNKKTYSLAIGFICFIIVIFAISVYDINNKISKLEEQNKVLIEDHNSEIQFITNFNKGKINYNYGVVERNNAEYNYNLWSYYYDEGYWLDSISFCVQARELYVSSNTYYQTAISYFELINKTQNELIDLYIEASDKIIDINWLMYEACEHFELASNSYSKDNFEAGNKQLEKGNEKILEHDNLIKTYNHYVSKIEILEKTE